MVETVPSHPRRWAILGVICFSLLVVVIDVTVLHVAAPAISEDLDPTALQLLWIIDVYPLVAAPLLITSGALGDRFGRKRLLISGMVLFGVASLAATFAPTAETLIAARAVMGVGGALIWPSVLGMTFALLPSEKAGLAGGLILGVAGIGNALGPLIGGALTEYASWRYILFLNVPIALIAIAAVYFLIHQPRPETEDRKIDYAGITTVSLGLVIFMVALDQVVDLGWGDPRIVISVFASVILLATFGVLERRAGSHALIPKDVMSNTAFTAACIAILFVSATFFSALFYVPQYLQKAGDYSAFQSGLGLLPFMAVFALTSFIAGPLYNRVGGRIIVTLGAACIALAYVTAFVGGAGTWGAGFSTSSSLPSTVVTTGSRFRASRRPRRPATTP